MPTSLVSLQQGNVTKSEKSMNDLRNFNEIFKKDVAYDNIKSQEIKAKTKSMKQGFTFSPENTTEIHPPAFLGLNLNFLTQNFMMENFVNSFRIFRITPFKG